MVSGNAFEARSQMAELLERVARGERVTVTRRGVPVAVMQPYEARPDEEVLAVAAELRAFRQGNSLEGLSLRDLMEKREGG
jgi:prevent-host-death family protein